MVELDDLIEFVGKQDETLQYSRHTPFRLIPYQNNFVSSVSYEVSLNKIMYKRTTYGIFNYLRDLGGLAAALTVISTGIVYIF